MSNSMAKSDVFLLSRSGPESGTALRPAYTNKELQRIDYMQTEILLEKILVPI